MRNLIKGLALCLLFLGCIELCRRHPSILWLILWVVGGLLLGESD